MINPKSLGAVSIVPPQVAPVENLVELLVGAVLRVEDPTFRE
jgi:hypothetical protein